MPSEVKSLEEDYLLSEVPSEADIILQREEEAEAGEEEKLDEEEYLFDEVTSEEEIILRREQEEAEEEVLEEEQQVDGAGGVIDQLNQLIDNEEHMDEMDRGKKRSNTLSQWL